MNKAFTLIELAIVIVIIGLITGGVLGAQSLIKSAKLNQQVIFFNDFETATNAFRLEYDELPGDMTQATSYFSGVSEIEDGDGNKRIKAPNHGFYYISAWESQELSQFWHHLSASGLMKNLSPTGNSRTKGLGFPKSPVNGTGAVLAWDRNVAGSGLYGHNLYMNVISDEIATGSTQIASSSGRRWLSSDAKKIDDKIDDGNALTGKFFVHNWYASAFAEKTGASWSYSSHCADSNGAYINLGYKGGENLGDAQVNHAYPCMMIYKPVSLNY